MNNFKIVIIGGGSVKWTPHFAIDLFLTPSLAGSRLVLVDINPEAAILLQRYCQLIAQRTGTGWRVEVADLDPALDGADAVGIAISTGSFEAMHHDVTIPEQFGIYHSVGDTVGPGGISRTLRNVPVFVDIARRMERLCPDTWMVHVTNPLAQITRCVTRATGVRCVGLCHNFASTIAFLADFLHCQPADIQATSTGVNHFTWLTDLTCQGRDVSERLTLENYLAYEAAQQGHQVRTGTTEDGEPAPIGLQALKYYLNFELFERFGAFPVGAASHVAENFPYYLNSPATVTRHRIGRKGVLPQRRDAQQQIRQKLIDRLEGRLPMPEPRTSAEQLAPVIAGLCGGDTLHTVVNVPNVGQIANLPVGAVVETWARVTHDRIAPVFAGNVPQSVAGLVQTIVHEEELAVEAALTGDRQKVIQAMAASPLVQDKDCIEALTDALLTANAAWLPQFARSSTRQSLSAASPA